MSAKIRIAKLALEKIQHLLDCL